MAPLLLFDHSEPRESEDMIPLLDRFLPAATGAETRFILALLGVILLWMLADRAMK